ncbi:hypothetical protein MM0352_04380 [Helicobacter pylori]
MIIKIARLQEVGLEISKTQILHENINKSGYKNLKNERHVRIKDKQNPAIKILNKTRFVKN